TPPATALLKVLLRDADGAVRRRAALALARRGQPPERKYLEELLRHGDASDRVKAYAAFAPHATRATFALFLVYPVSGEMLRNGGDSPSTLLDNLGKALRRDPTAAADLLKARDDGVRELFQIEMAQEVFKAAGPELLPMLFKALRSP